MTFNHMAYAIARVAKLKKANMVSSGAHTSRSKDTPNADPTKKIFDLLVILTLKRI
ncbi:MAG: hypothetical protein AAF757_10085 [Cyanobacteria bacterium P01_D01_bin.116]